MTSNAALNHRISGSKSLPDPAIEFHEEVFDIGGRSVIIGKAEAMNPTWRPTMEDVSVTHAPGTWGAEPDLAFFGLYDGHGGREIVDFLEHGLSFHVAQELAVDDESDIPTRLRRAFLMTDIHARHAGVLTSGATVATCLVKCEKQAPNRIEVVAANAGDSRVVLYHESLTSRLTEDHRASDISEVARIEQAGGFLFRERVLGVLALSRSLGDHLLKRFVIGHPSVRTETLNLSTETPGETFLLLACDGVFDVMSDEQAVAVIRESSSEKAGAARHLVEEALKRGSTDNVSAIVVWL